jgi:hypothetical protein
MWILKVSADAKGNVLRATSPSVLVQTVQRSERRVKMAIILSLPCRAEAGIASAQKTALLSSRQAYSTMRVNSRPLIDGDGTVIRFRPRGTAPRRELGLGSWDTTGDSPVDDLRRYKYASESDDDYRHRMRVNLFAAIVVIVLIIAGSWVVDTLVKTTWQGQNCYRPRGSDCAAIYMPSRQHG